MAISGNGDGIEGLQWQFAILFEDSTSNMLVDLSCLMMTYSRIIKSDKWI